MMTRQIIGLGFCAIAAFLFASRYICASIFGSSVTSWDASLFGRMYTYIGSDLSIGAGVSLLVGIAYIIWGEKTGK